MYCRFPYLAFLDFKTSKDFVFNNNLNARNLFLLSRHKKKKRNLKHSFFKNAEKKKNNTNLIAWNNYVKICKIYTDVANEYGMNLPSIPFFCCELTSRKKSNINPLDQYVIVNVKYSPSMDQRTLTSSDLFKVTDFRAKAELFFMINEIENKSEYLKYCTDPSYLTLNKDYNGVMAFNWRFKQTSFERKVKGNE